MISDGAKAMADTIKKYWPVDQQYEIAKALAANCGYQLAEEDDERSLEIKSIIRQYKHNAESKTNQLIIEGLEALLK